jgi:hypothetical protein
VLFLFPILAVLSSTPEMAYAPTPVDNPLKGLVPYATLSNFNFPCRMEFSYLPLNAVMTGPDQFDWYPVEELLQGVSSRGHQTIFRFYLDFPGKPSGVPQYLLDSGVHLTIFTNATTGKFEQFSPDYEDPRLRNALTNFVRALGQRYDGDSRIGFVEVGLLGAWGEWHAHRLGPKYFASPAVQDEVLDSYERAFKNTRLLVREPKSTSMSQRAFGWHDDSFAYQTIAPPADHFLGKLARFGGLDQWKSQPIGGEIRPEIWGCVFDNPSCAPKGQEFDRCVEDTHVSWLMDSGMYREKPSLPRFEQAGEWVHRMGYEFYISGVQSRWSPVDRSISVTLHVQNRGVAPFYYNWPVKLAVLNQRSELVITWPVDFKLTGILPASPDAVWSFTRAGIQIPAGSYKLLLQVPNPLPKGHGIYFANQTQNLDRSGWVTLGTLEIP